MIISINQHGWAITNLDDIAIRITKGGTPTTYGYSFQKEGINFFKVENISGGRVNLKSITDFISKEAHEFQSKSRLSVGDVLFSIAGTIGETCVIRQEYLPANTNQALAIIKGTDCAILPKLLEHQLEAFVAKVKIKARGGAMNNVSLDDLRKLQVYIPPLPEQHRIVAKIEELFSRLDKGIESLKTAQQQLKVYRQAVLKWAFEGKLTNKKVVEGELPKGWKWVLITDLVEKNKYALKAGPFGSSLKKEFYVKQGYKIYGQEQVISGDPFYGDYYVNEDKYQELFSNKIKPFDILISLVGTVGKVLILPENCAKGIINPRLIKISLDSNVYSPKFFKYYFESSTVKSFYSSKAQGTTMDVLNLSIIKKIYFPLCPLHEQHAIVAEIESRLSVCDKIEETIESSLKQSEALRQSILKKAFEGKLVFQDPSDEPASVLLARIKAEREKNKPENPWRRQPGKTGMNKARL